MGEERGRLGELLVKAKLMTEQQLEVILELQKTDGRRLGTLLVEQGVLSEGSVIQILGQQLSVPWVSLNHIDFSRKLLDLVPPDLAEEFCAIPIYVRRIRGFGEVLYVALDDPTNEQAVAAIARASGLHVRVMIAAPSDIRAALRVYYGVGASLPPDAHNEAFDEVHPPTIPPPSDSLAHLARANRAELEYVVVLELGGQRQIHVPLPRSASGPLHIGQTELEAELVRAADSIGEEPDEDDWRASFAALLQSLVLDEVVQSWRVVALSDLESS
jgi:hypothetical protein